MLRCSLYHRYRSGKTTKKTVYNSHSSNFSADHQKTLYKQATIEQLSLPNITENPVDNNFRNLLGRLNQNEISKT